MLGKARIDYHSLSTNARIQGTQMLGDAFIIVTNEKIAEDLLVRRAKIYSDRPMVR